jgi:hypothetical protein
LRLTENWKVYADLTEFTSALALLTHLEQMTDKTSANDDATNTIRLKVKKNSVVIMVLVTTVKCSLEFGVEWSGAVAVALGL